MRAKRSPARTLVASLISAILVLAAQPAAFAAPSHSMAMQMTGCASHEAMGCDHSMPKQDQSTPCKDMGNCLGMTSCASLAAFTLTVVSALPLALTAPQSWHVNSTGPGITHQPDNPPPIA
jgi:hypothetical protein